MSFSRLENKFNKAREEFTAGRLSEPEFKSQLLDLMIQDEQGYWWTIGYKTSQWYRHNGEVWEVGVPQRGIFQSLFRTRLNLPPFLQKVSWETLLNVFLPLLFAGGLWRSIVLSLSPDTSWMTFLLVFLRQMEFDFILALVASTVVWGIAQFKIRRSWLLLNLVSLTWVIFGRYPVGQFFGQTATFHVGVAGESYRFTYGTLELIMLVIFEYLTIFVLAFILSKLIVVLIRQWFLWQRTPVDDN
jgi:hypothetical protein